MSIIKQFNARRVKERYCSHLSSGAMVILCLSWLTIAHASEQTVNLFVGYKTVNFAGKAVKAIAVNNQIPGPALHFVEGDHVHINVYNRLDKPTAIHWHGLLVPWQMDGVEGVSQEPIAPNGVFHYQFTLKQSGTYWYHAHAGLQEQQGLYGAIIIEPKRPAAYSYMKDYTLVLSDWSNNAPEKIQANLKKEGDYYSSNFPLQPSLFHFMREYRSATPAKRQQLIAAYKMMQSMRMSIYDISDVAYDAFLLNGQAPNHPWQGYVQIGDTVRLRLINAGASTFFRFKIAGTRLQVVHVQGNDIKPYETDHITLAPAETYDVLVTIKKSSPYIVYAESTDTSGAAYGALVTEPQQTVDYTQITPFPVPDPVTSGHKMNMPEMAGGKSPTMSPMDGMDMGTGTSHQMMKSMANDSQSKAEPFQTTEANYQHLRAKHITNDPNKPVQIIKMELSGYMDRYMWFINGLPEYKAQPILIAPGKRYRIVFINNSMMPHPMHLHGHWFILRNGHGAFDPLLHTINISPGATAVVDFDADTSGQWFFHCHNLYHMMTGMARLFRYTTFLDDKPMQEPVQRQFPPRPNHPVVHMPGLYNSTFLDIAASPSDNAEKFTFKSLTGSDDNKLELYTEESEIKKGVIETADLDIFYWHLLSQFWAVKGGVNYVYRPTQRPYFQPGFGIEGLMPYFIDTNVRTYWQSGSAKFDIQLSRDTQITNNFFTRAGIRTLLATKTLKQENVGQRLNQIQLTLRPYLRIMPGVALYTEFEHTQYMGAAKDNQQVNNTSSDKTLSFGVSLLF